jgi:hypothetical protein
VAARVWSVHQGGGRRRPGGGARGDGVVHLLLLGPPLYSGEGVHLTPPPRQPRAAAKGRSRAAAAKVGLAAPQKP